MNDDWRIRVDLEEGRAESTLERLGLDLSFEARKLAEDLEGRRLVVSRDDETLFVYAGSRAEAEQARDLPARSFARRAPRDASARSSTGSRRKTAGMTRHHRNSRLSRRC